MAKRGSKKRIHKKLCEVCGAGVGEHIKMCSNCMYKQKLIRQIQQMIRNTDKEKIKLPKKKNTYLLTCLKCGRTFEYSSTLKKYCPDCDAEIRRERTRKCMQKKRAKSTVKFKTLTEVMQELKAYNKEHGTHLSYGQYVQMCEGR